MQIVRTIVWVLLLVALLLFSINNWQDVEVKIWENLILQTKLPALVILSFLLGLLPMWLLNKGTRWRFNRRINALENTVKAASAVAPVAVPTAPAEPATPENTNLTP
jgi:lipopolysaccharide assembly protein A